MLVDWGFKSLLRSDIQTANLSRLAVNDSDRGNGKKELAVSPDLFEVCGMTDISRNSPSRE
jgi:hypothetical protein